MKSEVFEQEHEEYRKTLRSFIQAEVQPYYAEWFEAGLLPRELYGKLADLGTFGIEVPEEYGGEGIKSFKFSAVQMEEVARAGVSFGGSSGHVALCLPYLLSLGTPEQLARLLPPFVSGETMYAIAMSEPGAGSDLAGMRTRAELSDDRTHYVLNGAKTFVTGGYHADRVIVCARTASPRGGDRRFGISLFVVDSTSLGFKVGRKLDKIGLRTSDTVELFMDDVEVPAMDLLGEENQGFSYLGAHLPRERLTIAYVAYTQAKAAVTFAQEYVERREIFGQPLSGFQNTKFELAACQADVDALQAVAHRALLALDAGDLSPAAAASAKLFCTELADRVIDRCLQLHGGYGYMNEYPIARLWADSRVNRIYGGSSEIMKLIIAKSMGL